MERQSGHRLSVRLDAPLPAEVAVGGGTALFVCGSCFDRETPIRELAIVVDGVAEPVTAHSMPRLDLFGALHPGLDPFATAAMHHDPDSEEDPRLQSYLSGFWGMAEIPAGTRERCELALSAVLADGSVITAPLASLKVSELGRGEGLKPPFPDDGPLVAICMATYEPPAELLRRQLDSIRAQTHRNWICLISDDCSSETGYGELESQVQGDPRFILSRSERRLGFYRNFERALTLAPTTAEFIALADQDDHWYPDKLATLLGAIGGAQLVYSDARVITENGEVLADSYWVRRRNNHTDLLSLLVANSVTGAASLFRAGLLDTVLPFPPAQFAHFHDHWLGLVALAGGEVGFVERPLYDYVQHGGATLGHAAANRMQALRDRLPALWRDPRERVRMWRLHYFVDVGRISQMVSVLQLRLGADMTPAKRSSLERFVRADHSPLALAGLWRRGARELLGEPQTLGAEWMLAYAFTWRRLLRATARSRPVRGWRLDAVPPPDLVLRPGREIVESPAARVISEKIAPLELVAADDAPERINLLIPTVDLGHFFGGYIGKFNLARRLAEAGRRVRIITVDPVGPLPRDWQRTIEGYAGLAGLFERVEIAFGREARELEVSRGDRFIATTWWTAHIAQAALSGLPAQRFLYLIQEYEPFTFAMGTYAALAAESYNFPHRALFSSELLREYFRRHELGVYADGRGAGDAASAAFANAITPVAPPTVSELAGRSTQRLLFYARPEPHASRNMFELGVLALAAAARSGALRGWELHGIGTIGGGSRLTLTEDARLELAARAGQSAYGELLRGYDVGLALMYTPHPSLVPIEMASAGLVTVTNRFENKTEAALQAISTNLRAPAPTISGVSEAIIRAAAEAEDHVARVAGAAVSWSHDWDESFSDELLARVIGMLDG